MPRKKDAHSSTSKLRFVTPDQEGSTKTLLQEEESAENIQQIIADQKKK